MHITDAIKFMYKLDKQEQLVNDELSRLNKLRRAAIQEEFQSRARNMIECARSRGIKWEPQVQQAVLRLYRQTAISGR